MYHLLRSVRYVLFAGMPILLAPMVDSAAAQNGGEGVPLGTATAHCQRGCLGVFDGCTLWEGVAVTFTSAVLTDSTSCMTSRTDRAAGCGVDVSFGSTIHASIDPSVIPAGYVLEDASYQEFMIPDRTSQRYIWWPGLCAAAG